MKDYLLTKLNDDEYWDDSFSEIKIQYDANRALFVEESKK